MSSDLLTCVKDSNIVTGICSDHCMVNLNIVLDEIHRGKGYWKLNTSYLKHDNEFCTMIKDKIKEFKELHADSDCNPHTIWDAFKCTIVGLCIEYCSRKQKEKIKNKSKLLKNISSIKEKIGSVLIKMNCRNCMES